MASNSNDRRAAFEMCQEAFETQMFTLCEMLDEMEDALRKEKEQYRAIQREVEHLNAGMEECTLLDVGGTNFHVSKSSLTRIDGHMLKVLVSGIFAPEEDSEGYIFLDRDPAQFAAVLAYLRDGTIWHYSPNSDFRRECRYYGLPDLTLDRYLVVFGVLHFEPSISVSTLATGVVGFFNLVTQSWTVRPFQSTSPDQHLPRDMQFTACADSRGDRVYVAAISAQSAFISMVDLRCQTTQWLANLEPEQPVQAIEFCWDRIMVISDFYGMPDCPHFLDPLTLTWDPASLPAPESPSQTCVVGDLLFVVGRECMFARRGEDVYHQTSPMPTLRRESGLVSWRGNLVTIGGRMSGTSAPSRVVEVYDPATNVWAPLPSLTVARRKAVAVVVDDSIYVLGGVRNRSLIKVMERYDPENNVWVEVGSHPFFATSGARAVMQYLKPDIRDLSIGLPGEVL